jgi:hypothetical protein
MRDPAVILALVFLFLAIQTFVWIIGRYSLELDLWRTAPFAFVLLYAMPVLTATGVTLTSIILSFAIPALIVWAMAGFFYEPDLRQRIAMSTVLPVLGMIALPLGFYLRRVIFSY